MENHVNQSPAIPKWSALLIEAVTKPGLIMKAYSAFHSYSTGNQILALVQCQMRGLQPGPINTFPKWKDLGRFVKRGERALTLCMPITCKRREEDSDEEHTFTSFVYKARWFVLAQTDGQELEPITIPEWDADRALSALSIERVPFDHTDGNVQGFAVSARSQLTRLHNCRTRHFFTKWPTHFYIRQRAISQTLKPRRAVCERSKPNPWRFFVANLWGLKGQSFAEGIFKIGSAVETVLMPKRYPEKSAQKIFRAADQISEPDAPKSIPSQHNNP